jgi:hypothetical protein
MGYMVVKIKPCNFKQILKTSNNGSTSCQNQVLEILKTNPKTKTYKMMSNQALELQTNPKNLEPSFTLI